MDAGRHVSQHRVVRPPSATRVGRAPGRTRRLAGRKDELGALGRPRRGRSRLVRSPRRRSRRAGGDRPERLHARRARRSLDPGRRARPRARRRVHLSALSVHGAGASRRDGAAGSARPACLRDRATCRRRRLQRRADGDGRGRRPRRDRGRCGGARRLHGRRRDAGGRLAPVRRGALRRRRGARLQVDDVPARDGVHGDRA